MATGEWKIYFIRVSDKVLKNAIEIRRLNFNKFKDKYEGLYEVKQVLGNGETYVLKKCDE